MGPFKSLITATAVRYLVAMLGSLLGGFLIAKGFVSAEAWAYIQSALDNGAWPFISVLLAGGSIIAALGAAGTGISEAGKNKVVLDGVKYQVHPDDKRTVRSVVVGDYDERDPMTGLPK